MYANVRTFLILFYLELVLGKVWYEAQFTDSILPCPDFENKDVMADGIKLGMTEGCDDEEPAFGLSGPLVLNAPVEDGVSINMNIFKATELGEEYMFKSAVKVCDSIKDEDVPWHPLFEMMNITCCPINKGEYHIKDFKLEMSSFSDLLCRDFCGEYSVEMAMMKDLDKISCHYIQLAVVEHDDDD